MSIAVRILFSVPRSGSTLFMSIMANAADTGVTSRTILMGNYYKTGTDRNGNYNSEFATFSPDHSIYNGLTGGDGLAKHPVIKMAEQDNIPCLISKEEVGNNRHRGTLEENECNLRLYPDKQALCAVKPAFVFRHPVSCFASWYKLGWRDLDSFIMAYKNVFETASLAKRLRPETVIYKLEDISGHPKVAEKVFSAICHDWGLEFSPKMLSLDGEFAERFLFWNPREEKIYREENPKGIFTTLKSAKAIFTQPSQTDFLPHDIKDRIKRELVPLYEALDTSMFHRPSLIGHGSKHEIYQPK